MKTIKCDRCGKEIPYTPPYMNAATQQGVVPPQLMITIWNNLASPPMREVDLCSVCKLEVYDFIFDHSRHSKNRGVPNDE